MHEISESVLYSTITQANNPANVDARMTILAMGSDYSHELTGYALRAVYLMVYQDFEKLLCANKALADVGMSDLDSFKKSPGLKTLHNLISSITEFCRSRSPQVYFAINDKIGIIFKHLSSNLDDILNEKFPGLSGMQIREAKEITDAVREFRGKNDYASFYAFIKALSAKGPSIKFRDMMDEYTASCITADNHDFVKAYLDQHKYVCDGFNIYKRSYFDGHNDIGYTAIIPHLKPCSVIESQTLTVAVTRGNTHLEHFTLQVPSQYNFFVGSEDIDTRSIFIEYQNDGSKTIKFLNGIVAGIAMAFGRENTEFVIEDQLNTGITWEVESMIQPSRLTVCKTGASVTESLDALSNFVENRIERLGNYMRNLRKGGSVIENALVAIFVNPKHLGGDDAKRYRNIVTRGYRAGVMVISLMPIVDIMSIATSESLTFRLSEHCSIHYELSSMALSGCKHIDDHWFENWLKGAPKLNVKWSRNLGKIIEEETEVVVDELEHGFTVLADSKLSTTIGQSDDSEFTFNFDTTAHTHAFIIGKTGSGKSVLLHNIITGLMHKYSPADLQLYLLDFKLGGVEFNRYRNVKHLRSLLVDNSDFQIVLEIMRDIDKQMKQRGKTLRNAGCNNISDYNKANKDNPMPQIVIVIDECHQSFNTSASANAKMQLEITGVLTKVAKEGRNQGVHLIFATQTLAGADMPTDIINNVTDYYLMNCAPADSERLVSGSSRFTDGLSVGKVYYHHVEHNKVFQGNYVSNEKSCQFVDKIIQKSDAYVGNGQLYFNGSQEYGLIDNLPDLASSPSMLQVICGKSVDLDRKDLTINLPDDYCENVLVCGLNCGDNTTRTAIAPALSLMLAQIKSKLCYRIIVLNCCRNGGESITLLEQLSARGHIQYYSGDKRPVLDSLAREINSGIDLQPTLLCILGQEQMRELKMNMKLSDNIEATEKEEEYVDDLFSGIDFDIGNDAGIPETVAEALNLILDKGPIAGVHTIMQLDKIDRFLFDEYPSRREVFSKFKHLILLRTDEATPSKLNLAADCHPERLSDDESRLRGIYYNDDMDSYTLFSPYTVPTLEDIESFIIK